MGRGRGAGDAAASVASIPPRSTRHAARPGAWLCTVARHLVIDARRARQSRPAEVGGDVLERAAEQKPGEDEIEQALQSWAVADAVRSLSPDHRVVLLETYYQGRTMAEAAQVLGIPLGTVKSRTYYALHALRLALQERRIEP